MLLLAACTNLRTGGAHPRMAASVTAPTVELLQFLPMLPPLAPGTAASAALSVDGGLLSSPVWMPERGSIALMDRGRQALLSADAATADVLPSAGGEGVAAHALLGGGALAVASGSALRCLVLDPPRPAALPLEGANELSGVGVLCPLSDARLLVGTNDGRLLCLSSEDAPATLLTLAVGGDGPEAGTLRGACVSDDERTLYLCDDLDVYRCGLDLGEGTCTAPEMLPQLEASLGGDSEITGIACDVSGNLYVAATEGVLLVDESGDAMMRIGTPVPATGLCFGGPSMSELLVTAGDTLWRLQTSTQGVKPPSAEFLQYMDKMAAVGEYRHEGW